MTDQTINGVLTLAIGNLVVMLLAVSIRQRTRAVRDVIRPSLLTAVSVLVFHVAVQIAAVSIASRFFVDTRTLIALAAILAALPTAWCLLLINDWLVFGRKSESPAQAADPGEAVDMEAARRYLALGEYENAKQAYRAYAKAHPKSAEPLFGLEGVYLAQGRFHDAAKVCRDVMRSFQHDVVAWTKAADRLANLLETQLRNPQEAEDLREEIARRNPSYAAKPGAGKDVEAPVDEQTMRERIEKARELAQNNSTDSAVAVLKRLRKSNPRDPRPLFELAVVFEATLQTEAARRSLETIVRDFSGSPGVWSEASMKLADLYLQRYGNDETARELLERVIEKSPLAEDRNAAKARLDKLNSPWL